eukprot:270827-Chlamydomonas_euryale.AAC.1
MTPPRPPPPRLCRLRPFSGWHRCRRRVEWDWLLPYRSCCLVLRPVSTKASLFSDVKEWTSGRDREADKQQDVCEHVTPGAAKPGAGGKLVEAAHRRS